MVDGSSNKLFPQPVLRKVQRIHYYQAFALVTIKFRSFFIFNLMTNRDMLVTRRLKHHEPNQGSETLFGAPQEERRSASHRHGGRFTIRDLRIPAPVR